MTMQQPQHPQQGGYYPPQPNQQYRPPPQYVQPPAYGQAPAPPQQQQPPNYPYGNAPPQAAQFDPQNFLNDAAAKVIMNPGAWQALGDQAWNSGQQYVNKNVRSLPSKSIDADALRS
jgi:hypothetical protein